MNGRKMQSSDTLAVSRQAACSYCALGKLCFPTAAPTAYDALFPLAREQRIRLTRGESLFHANDQVVGVYAVKAGFLKTCIPLPDGQSKIAGFHAMGAVLGLDSLGSDTHRSDAIALSGCEVCIVPLDKFEKLLGQPAESLHMRQLLSFEIARADAHAATIGLLTSKQRVATFLLDMSERWDDQGYSRNEFVLFMSRKEIGNFLGLTFETVSRNLSYFQAMKWISVQGKNLQIRDIPALRKQIALTNDKAKKDSKLLHLSPSRH